MTNRTDEGPNDVTIPRIRGFWEWLLFRDSEGDRGIKNLVSWWNAFGILLAFVFAISAGESAAELAKNVALPGAAALVGLSFAWAGRSASLLQDREFSEFIINYGPPAEGYIYSFQLAVLVVTSFVITSLSLLAGGFDVTSGSPHIDAVANRFILFAVGFLAARECWGVIYFANKLSIQFFKIREEKLRE